MQKCIKGDVNMKKSLWMISLLSIFFSLFFYHPKANAETLQEWILYFNDRANYLKFIEDYRDRIEGTSEELALNASFSPKEIEKIQQLSIVSHIEPNYKKSLAAVSPTFNDPLLSEQWGLEKVNAYQAVSKFTPENLLYGKHFLINNESIIYQEQPLNVLSFKVLLDKTKLSRISVELDHVEGPWSLEVRDENGTMIAANQGKLEKLDVLLPKNHTYDHLQIMVKNIAGWNNPPVIKKVTGVHHILVAVIDTGVSPHKDFCDNVLHSLGKDYINGNGLAIDENGHGTHVTGIIAACSNNGEGVAGTIGFAPVDILPLKVLDKNGNGSDFDIANAVNDAVLFHADIINLSLAGQGETTILREAIQNALMQNIVVVAAAGNWRTSIENIYPASYPGVITVAATDQNNNIFAYSNYGWKVDISAPGLNIISTYLDQNYQSLSGTSMATPYVTGAAAVLKSSDPALDVIQIRKRLFQSALDIKDKGYDIYSGHGLVQISQAVNLPSREEIDWLTIKDFQKVDFSKEQILGVSNGLIGKDIYVFTEGQLVLKLKADRRWISTTLPSINSVRNKRKVLVVAADKNGKVLTTDERLITARYGGDLESFSDVSKTYWAYEEIQRAYQQHFINGFSDGKFRPNEHLKRRHGLMMVHRLFDWPLYDLSSPFKDTPIDLSGALSIYAAYDQQVVKGYENGRFNPENLLTRGQMAVILARALKLSETSFEGTPHPFKDLSNPEHFAYYAVQQLADKGIITKQEYFRPNEFITRAQFAAMVMRTYDYLQGR
jgi:Subtilase family/S-layer homology domain